jgi:uncharacterized protein YcbK (DUF882 family)
VLPRAIARALTGLAILTAAAAATPALGDVTHIVQRGHTVEAIAHRYGVSVKAILEANHLSDPSRLKPGQVLVIPGVSGSSKSKKDARHEDEDKSGGRAASASLERSPEPRGRGGEDTIHALRAGEEFRIRVKDGHGRIPPATLTAFQKMMRQGDATHPVDPRLVALLGIVSNHFGGKTIEVVSGYRAYSPTQYTPHSNHNVGKALDFRIRGVPNEALRDFCRTLRNAGCGYYPNSTFVHLDVRETKAYWVDWSRPGEPPKYDKPGSPADEGTSDVPDDQVAAAPAPGSEVSMDPGPSAPGGSGETHGAVPTSGSDE